MNSSAILVSALLFLSVPQAHAAPTAPVTIDRGYADLVKKVGPGVVNISTFARPRPQPGQNGMDNERFRQFFEQFFGGRMGPPGARPGEGFSDDQGGEDERPQQRVPRASPKAKIQPLALGTGFIIDAAEGLIVTNYHVVQDSEEVKIQLSEDDEMIPAEVIGRDPELDIALLKVKVKTKLSSIALGDSDKIDVGEYVIAIGNPLGYGHTVSHGILSAKGRRNPEFRLGRYLQTDASINPGNSGGPLVNMRGEVIGINNAIDARGQGIGFAIPINLVKSVITQLKTKGQVSRGFIGISAAEFTPDMAEQLKLDPKIRGVMIVDVARGLPADKAGIKPYDIVTAVNGEKIYDSQDLTTKITSVAVGSAAEVTLVRNGKEKKIKVTVVERPVAGLQPGPGGKPTPSRKAEKTAEIEEFGLEVAELSEANAKDFGVPAAALKGKKLIVVSDLTPDLPASEVGISRGDVLLDIAGKEIHSVAEAVNAFKTGKGKSVLVRVKRFGPQGESSVNVVVLSR